MDIHIFIKYVFNLQWIKLPVSREVTQTVEAMLLSSTASSDSRSKDFTTTSSPTALRQLQRKSDWAECYTARVLRRRVIMWLQAFPKGWCLSTHWCDDFFPASSLLWPTPGAYLQSGSLSLSLLPNWNKFTQLQLEGLQTIRFLFPFLGKKPFPWGPRLPLFSVIPNCSSGWLHSQPASAEMLQFFI